MPSTRWREQVVRNARRIVVKVGTNTLTDERGRLELPFLRALAAQVARVVRGGIGVTLVSSGAVGAGMAELDLPERPRTLPLLQATAAVGQGQLMRHFYDAFREHGSQVAQILVTRGDFEDRTRYLNIRNTITALHDLGAVPIINENDSVGVEELSLRFGDNDIIAAHLTNMLRADLLVLLSVVDGVLKDGAVLDVIENPAADGPAIVQRTRSRLGSGGMGSKLTAAGMVADAGEVVIVANGRTQDILPRLLAGEKLGTLIVPAGQKMTSRQRWIGQVARAAGRIVVDGGAVRALREQGKSLLPSGVTGSEGRFRRGDTVAIVDAAGQVIARGLTNYGSDQVEAIKGRRTREIAQVLGGDDHYDDEVVHRNNMLVL